MYTSALVLSLGVEIMFAEHPYVNCGEILERMGSVATLRIVIVVESTTCNLGHGHYERIW
jgi:hypothetical protein